MLKVTLRISNGLMDDQGPVIEEQTFSQDFISGRAFRKTVEMQKSIDPQNVDTDTLDRMVDYVVYLFGGKFTADQFYDGIAAGQLISTIVGCINVVVGSATKALGTETDPNA